MRPFTVGDMLTLFDRAGTPLGTAVIDTVAEPVLQGTFRPFPAFDRVADLFHRFEEHVDAAALAILPSIEQHIAELGLRIGRLGESSSSICDVQIYTDGGFSCRLMIPTTMNGRPEEASSAAPA